MSASLYGPIALDLADGPVTVDTSRGFDGRQRVRLIFGEGTQSVAVSLTASPMATLLQLQEAVAQAIAATQQQDRPLTEAA